MHPVNQCIQKKQRPMKILQFGEGNFIRAFTGQMVDIANEKGMFDGGIQIVKAIAHGSLNDLWEQDCIYTVLLRGKQDGGVTVDKRIITAVNGAVCATSEYGQYAALAKRPTLRFIISNTTEAGIVFDDRDDINGQPPKSFPGKLTKLMYERFQAFNGARDKGLIILPLELIEKNGGQLKSCCEKLAALWGLPQEFLIWLDASNVFCNTLVDRIVSGYPMDEAGALEKEWGYTDKKMVVGEPYGLWVIEHPHPEIIQKELPLDQAGLPVVFTHDLQPYRERKVRILNGGHTASALAAYLAGLDTVGEMMKDKTLRAFLTHVIYQELAVSVPLPADEVKTFADSVIERFENPFIQHQLLSISLNSVSKFSVRVLPAMVEMHQKTGKLPSGLCFSLAALMQFYSGTMDGHGKFTGKRNGMEYAIIDDEPVLNFFAQHLHLSAEELVKTFLSREDFWGSSLLSIPEIADMVTGHLVDIRRVGIRDAMGKWVL